MSTVITDIESKLFETASEVECYATSRQVFNSLSTPFLFPEKHCLHGNPGNIANFEKLSTYCIKH